MGIHHNFYLSPRKFTSQASEKMRKMAHDQETYEMNFSKTNKNYDVYPWHWLLFGLIYLNIPAFIFDVL